MRGTKAVRYARGVAAIVLLTGVAASAQVQDRNVVLNYNFHGMAHAGETVATNTNSNADVINFRSISDRGLYFDASDQHSVGYSAVPPVGATGITYRFFDTLAPGLPGDLDMVHLGDRSVQNPFEAVVNTATSIGIFPTWQPSGTTSQTGPQTTTISPGVVIDQATEIGVLYNISNSGGQFDVVLGFSDATTITVRLSGPDWVGNQADPAILANQPVSSQRKLLHTVGTTTYNNFRATTNNDAATLAAFNLSNLSPNILVMEGIISVPRIIAGVGTFPPTPGIVGKTLTSLTFQNATYTTATPGSGRGYAILASTVRNGSPTNSVCGAATPIGAGATATTNAHAFGAAASPCGNNDNSAVWYSYVATGNNLVEARTCGSAFDTTLTVYASCGGSAITCNDTGCGTASRAQWQATTGSLYLIRVAGNAGATGNFTLTVIDPAPIEIPMPLAYNFNGLVQGPSEYGIAAPAPNNTHENRSDLNGYRSLADRGLLVDGSATSINFGGTLSTGTTGTGISYQVSTTALQPDVVYMGDRQFVANGARAFATSGPPFANNNGLQPVWLPNTDLTGPQVSSMTSLGAVLGTATRIGVIYNISDSGGQFDCRLDFTDATSATVTLRAPDWFGDRSTSYATLPLGAGVALQRQLGVFNSVDNTDNDKPVTASSSFLNVTEAVFDRDSLLSGLGFDIAGRTLSAITFLNPVSNAAYVNPGATPGNRSGFAIIGATLRNPQSVTLNFNPTANGTVTPNQLVAHATGKMTVSVTRGTGTPNNITGVTVNASSIGLSSSLTLFDNGSNGDVTAGDNTFSRNFAVPVNTTAAVYQLPFDAVDAQGRHATGNIIFTLLPPTGLVTPSPVLAGNSALATFDLGPNNSSGTDITSVQVDAGQIGAGLINLNDAAANGDLTAGDGIWSGTLSVPFNAIGGAFNLPYTVMDASARMVNGSLPATVIGRPAATDLGILTPGVRSESAGLVAGGVVWFTFTLTDNVDASALSFLDIDTEGSSILGGNLPNDTFIALYDSTGNRIGAADDDDGSDNFSQLTFGASSPARPPIGNGLAYNGRDGATLAAGTYYLAVTGFTATFNPTLWNVTTAHLYSGTVFVNLRLGATPTGGLPGTFTDLGNIPVGTTTAPTMVTNSQLLSAGGVHWFRFTVPATVDGSALSRQYLDIDTEGSLVPDTLIALFRDDGSGTLVASDNDDGTATYSQFSYGRGNRAAPGDGLAYNGRDGVTLIAGTYYLAVTEFSAAFANNFVVAFTTGLTTGDVTVNIRSGVQSPIQFGPVTNPANNHKYYLFEQGFTFTEAEMLAASLVNGHLASINDADENEWVRVNVLIHDFVDRRAWIGLTDEAAEGVFAWTDGSPVTFTNWGAGEPNDGAGGEDYTEMLGGNGAWNDIKVVGAGTPGGLDFALVEVEGCIADFNGNGSVTVQDIFDFLSAYFTADPRADVNQSGAVTVQDIFDYLVAYFAGCA